MDAFICTTCGTQFAPTEAPPPSCLVCTDERQYVGQLGQSWTTLPKLTRSHMTTFRDEAGLIGIGTAPNIGIGQRALLLRTPHGNILWDCISLVEPVAVEMIKGVGGLAAIAISHPHYYTAMLEWSRAFGGATIYLHAADREWVMRDGPEIEYWQGDTRTIAPGVTLIRCGGHFEGGAVLHHAAGSGGRGALLSGDILQVVADRAHLGFMRSYPNFIPLGAAAVRAIEERLRPWSFEAIYGAFWNAVIPQNAAAAFARSVQRHIDWLARDAM
jgi:hypothetical protein